MLQWKEIEKTFDNSENYDSETFPLILLAPKRNHKASKKNKGHPCRPGDMSIWNYIIWYHEEGLKKKKNDIEVLAAI